MLVAIRRYGISPDWCPTVSRKPFLFQPPNTGTSVFADHLGAIDARRYGFLGLNKNETRWGNGTLTGGALNISAFYIDPKGPYFGHDWADPRTGVHPYQDPNNFVLASAGSTTPLSIDYIQRNGICQSIAVGAGRRRCESRITGSLAADFFA